MHAVHLMAIKAITSHNQNHTLLSFIPILLVLLPGLCYCQTDRLQQGQVLKDGEELVSAYGNFRLGFFSPYGMRNRYLGIYYKRPIDRLASYDRNYTYSRYINVFHPGCYENMSSPSLSDLETATLPQPVWVANRDTPILYNESATLVMDGADGNLKILRNRRDPIVISSVQAKGNITSAVLLKNGNLVLYEMKSDGLSVRRELWQSFDYPTNTLLPGMKLGINLRTGQRRFLRSWSCESAAEGSYVIGMDPNVTNKLVIWKGTEVNWTSGIWLNGSLNSNFPQNSSYNFSYTSNEQERYLTYSVNEDVTSFPVLTIDSVGGLIDDLGRDISCSAFQGCANPNLFNTEGGKSKWWLWLIIAVAAAPGLYFGYRIRRNYFKAEEEKRWMSLAIVVAVASVVPVLCYASFLLLKKLKAKVESMVNRQKLLRELGDKSSLPTIFGNRKAQANKDQTTKRDLKIFDFQTIAAATDNFSTANRLGQGGFGPVYKGKLLDGQEIAIKRLSKSSGQGIVEFKNEAKLIAKLQHTNLVRLLGCSLQKGERLLVYEYLPNKSLDFFIFDSSKKELLDWKKRFNIIEGIVQGLLYLHKYSRLRVIHRDLKASNILLDDQMNPKISDFGMARTFGMNELEANTNRIVGTHGYMSPEYVMNGIVSMKSDVYSFGVLVLEIISSKKNNGCYDTERPLNLVGYAWQLWNEGKALELIDTTLHESCSPDEVTRCIHVGLLCVQDKATDRPTMSDVASMLTNDTMALPTPKQPAFFINISSDYEEPEVTEIKLEVCSVNDVTISRMEAR
ncbi:G-type lectin S-receptor-like serine/threonine-protein kinase CES101 isoform X4 [Citrus sinensis]|uniref:G-type lectin S-receptor-like serine/threonine-protein kinase CES101 isoform X4 n=1 Tax=Citrus sinensis TaxID=2711 RepID=UPI00227910CD|nr:G-type lectin S-receptor-like serine/threonine-protein kinase CES101 isoform X4 [Citrus sinensis]